MDARIRVEKHGAGNSNGCGLRRTLNDRGQGLVEFALILPVFMLLVLGMLDFGSAYNVHNNMTQLAGEAVRFASVNSCGVGCPSIERQVQQDADTSRVIQTCFWFPDSSDGKGHVGNQVQAVLRTTYQWIPFNLLGFVHVGSVELKATATMRLEQSPDPVPHYTVAPGNDCSS